VISTQSQIRRESVLAALAAETAFLVTAGRTGRIELVISVCPRSQVKPIMFAREHAVLHRDLET
jgi:hypothetical protein